jgi:hypothetical protein
VTRSGFKPGLAVRLSTSRELGPLTTAQEMSSGVPSRWRHGPACGGIEGIGRDRLATDTRRRRDLLTGVCDSFVKSTPRIAASRQKSLNASQFEK